MSQHEQLIEKVGTSSLAHGEATKALIVSLDQFDGTPAGAELAHEFSDWCRTHFRSRRMEILSITADFRVFISMENPYAFVGIVNDTKVTLLRLVQRLMPEFFGMVNQARLIQVFDLPRDRRQVTERIRHQIVRQSEAPPDPGAARALRHDDLREIEAAHQRLGPDRFADLFVRSQSIALIKHDRPPQPVMTEYYVSLDALRKHLLTGVDLRKDENLFSLLTVTLDRMVLRSVKALKIPLRGNSSLNLNVQTVFSGEFESLDSNLGRDLQHLTIEFRASDIVQNFDQFMVARELILSRGGTVAVDAIFPTMIDVVAVVPIGARLAKVFWRAGAAPDLFDRQAEIRRWQEAGTVVVLAHLDDGDALDVGRQLGIGLFQGFHVDKLLRPTAAREEFKVN